MAGVYNRGKAGLANGTVDWDTSDLRGLLVTSAYTFDADHNTVSQITNELVGTGYVRKSLTCTVVENDASDRAELTIAALTWTAIDAGTPVALVVYKHDAGGDASSQLFGYFDFTAVTTNGGDLTVNFASDNAVLVS